MRETNVVIHCKHTATDLQQLDVITATR